MRLLADCCLRRFCWPLAGGLPEVSPAHSTRAKAIDKTAAGPMALPVTF
jgi:hypothetical protein